MKKMLNWLVGCGILACLMVTNALSAAPILLRQASFDPATLPKAKVQSATFTAADAQIPARGLYLIQHEGVITPEWRSKLERAGAIIRRYIPENAYLVEVFAESYAAVSAIEHSYFGEFKGSYKIDLPISTSVMQTTAKDVIGSNSTASGISVCVVSLFERETREMVVERLKALDGAEVISSGGKAIRVKLTTEGMRIVSEWVEVESIGPYVKPTLNNNVAVQAPRMNVETVWPSGGTDLGLTGEGQVVAVADTGLDTGDKNTVHEDVRGRITRAYALGRSGDWSDPDGHGTHVVGAVLGDGKKSTSPKIRGVAYKSSLIFQSTMDAAGELGGLPDDVNDLFEQAYVAENGMEGARIHSNSWGSGRQKGSFIHGGQFVSADFFLGRYDVSTKQVDEFVFDHPDMCIIFAAGNDGVDLSPSDGVVDSDSMGAQPSAKNCITVGNSENYRTNGGMADIRYGQMTWSYLGEFKLVFPKDPIKSDYFVRDPNGGSVQGIAGRSSRGPCDDGRVKPDVVAPGQQTLSLLSTKSETPDQYNSYNSYYRYMNGTSMAAPLVAGSAALVRQWLAQKRNIPNPDGATIKAMLLSGAKSLTPGQYGTGSYREIPSTYPNNVEGWGQVNLGNTVANEHGIEVYDAQVIGHGETQEFSICVETAGNPLAIVMVYTDAPGSVAVTKELVNDLDLTVRTPSGTILYPNSRTSADNINNVEGVRIGNAEKGTYTLTVKARSITTPMATKWTGGKSNATRYSLVVNGAVENNKQKSVVPTGVAAEPASDGSKVTLGWNHGDTDATYYIYRSEQNSAPATWHATVTAAKSYVDTKNLVRGKTYYYWVSAKSAGNEYAESEKVAFGPVTVPVKLAKPVLTPSSTEFTDSITVSCSASGVTIRYTVDGSTPTATSAVWPTAGLKIVQTTTVKARAFKDGSEESDVTAATYTKLIPPNAPTNFKVAGTDSLSLSWNAVSGAEKYRIYRNTSNTRPTGKPYKEISVRSLTDKGAVPGITYWYWVAAVGSNGLESDWVGPKSGTVAVVLELDQVEKTFPAQGGNENLRITANVDWTVSCSPWITPSCRNGSGSAMLGYTVEPTDDVTDRPGIIRISSASDSRYYVELAVTQTGKKPIAALGVAVGNTDLSFWTGGNAMWTAVTTADSFASEGTYVRSGQIVAGQSSHVETIVNGAGTLKFRYAPSKVNAAGKLVVLIDGTEWFWTTFGNDDSWKTKSISVSGVGDHRVRWEYRLEQSDSSYVKLDSVEFGEAFRPSVPVPGSVSETDHLVVLMWNLEEEWEMGTRYRIYRGTSLAGPRDCIAEETVSTSSSFLRSFVRYEDATGLPGVAYYYWLEGVNESGTVVSAAVQGMKPDTGRPDNDDFDYAGKLEGIGGTAVGTTVKATLEQTPQWTEQPMQSNGKGANTIWWTLSAPMKGVLELDFSQSDVAVVFEVYKKPSGWDVISIPGTHNETLLWAEKDGQTQGCQVSVDAYATYIIRVAGFNDAQGTVRMDWSVSLPQAKVWYVNGSAGKDSNDGLSRQTAKQTIQAAVNGADEGDTVLVAAGVYAAFSAAAANEITIRSEDGPAVTVIDGADASICANLGDIQSESGGLVIIPSIGGGETSHVNTLVGFTVRNGYAQNGGGVYGGIVRNCIVSNNFARSYGGGTYGSSLANCLVVGNEATSKAGGVYGGIVRNCTIVYNRAGAYGGLYMSSPMANDGGTCRNSIVWGNENLDGEVSNYSSSEAMFDCCSSPANKYYSFGMGGLIVDQDPLLNSSSGFYEPAQDSPCIDAGDDEYAPDGLDLRGNERIVSGGVDLGAIESQYVPPPVYVQVSFDANGGSGNMAPQTFVVGEAQPLTHNAFTKSGCFFQGWSKLPTASFATYADGQVVTIERESVWKLYAIWGTAPAPDDPTPVVRRPDNDDFASAIAIEGAEGTTMGLTIGATLEPNERKMTDDPFGINIGIGVVQTPLPTNTIWWTWTAPFTGTMTVDFSGSDIDVAFDVFRTTSLPEDSFMGGGPLASSYGGTDLVRRFAVTSGKCYYIRAAGFANAGGFVTFKWRLKNETWFVNATSGDDANDGLTRAKAKRTIQAAIDDAGSGDTIIVADGVYGAFSAESVNAVTIQSENGPAATVVDGDGQMSCANLGDIRSAGATIVPPTIGGEATPHVNTLIGFTLRNGNADRGGGIYGGIVRNCIVSNNFAHVYGGGTYGSELINCLVVGNMTTNVAGGVYGGGEVRNCTIVFNAAKRHGGLYMDDPLSLYAGAGSCRNSIVWGNEDQDGETSNYSDEDALFDCCSYPGRPSYYSYGSLGAGGKIISADPQLNLTSGLYEPMAGSPCIDAGDDTAVTTDDDLIGNARIVGDAVDIGAIECQEILPDMVTVWFDANGGDPEMQSKSYVPGMHYGVFPDQPECFGFTFDGWFDRQEGGVRLSETESVVPSSATTNFAQWAANVYRLSYALGAGAVLGANSPTEGAYGETMAVPAPTRRGYRFAGWLVTGSLDTSIACWGATPDDMSELSGTDVICFGGEAGTVYFRDLSAVQGAFVVLSARWEEKDEFEIDDQGVLLSYNGASASVVIPPSVTSIGASAFAGCVELEELVVPATVESIGDFAFQGSGLRRIEFMGSAPTVGVGIFRDTADELTVYVRRAAGGWTDAQTNLLPAVWPTDDTDGRAIAYVAGARLTVVSAFGSPDPSTGVHEYDLGEDVTASISSPVYESDDIRHVCLGWDGTGSVPTGDNGTVVNFRADEDSSLTWNWRTDYLLSFVDAENGTISDEKGQFSFAFDTWQPDGSNVRVVALPDDGYKFDGWTGDTDGCTVNGNTITIPMSKPRQIGATFVQDVQVQVATPVISPADGSTFDTDSCTVEITCATPGATIYYSTNGSSPRLKDQFKYTQPFTVTETTTIKAVAVKDGFTQSEIATATITKVAPPPLTLASALDEPKLSAVNTDGDAEWEPDKDVTAVGGSSARSGEIGMLQRTCLKATVYGKGTLSFNWKVSCEDDYSGLYTYDHLTFSTVEGGRTNDMAKIDGKTGWLPESVTFTTDGPHNILWTYSTDDWEEPGFKDCGWVDNVVWTGDAPPSDIVISDVVTLPKAEVEAFMAKYPSLAAQVGGDAEAFAKLPSATGKLDANGNQMYVWQDIIAGTDPTNPDDKFKIVDIKFEDGELKITWSPDLKDARKYTEFGRKELGGTEVWTDMKDVNPVEKNDYKFRKVMVDMP